MKKINLVLLFLLIFSNCCAEPISYFSERTSYGNENQLTIYSYPKYYLENNQYQEVNCNIVSSFYAEWNWEVKKGVYKLRIKNNGTFEQNHLGDIVTQKIIGIGFFNSDTKERIIKFNLTLSNPTINGNEISWTLPLGCLYKLVYTNDILKDILIISQQAKTYLKNNKPIGWAIQNTWIGIIYDMDLSQSRMIESKDFETDEDIKFIKDGKIKHRIMLGIVKHSLYTGIPGYDIGKFWLKKKFYRNGKYVEAIKINALDSIDGNLLFNTDITFQEGIDAYAGTDDCDMDEQWNPNTNLGTSTTFAADGSNSEAEDRSVIKFDLSSIPSNATVSSAILSIKNLNNTDGSGTWYVHRCFKPWIESTVTWNDWDSPNNEWGTSGAKNASDSGSDNSGDGSDYDIKSTAEASVTKSPWDGTIFRNFTITTAVQNWVDGTWGNRGLVLSSNNLIVNNGGTFASSENATTADRPKLAITYTVPSGSITQPIINIF